MDKLFQSLSPAEQQKFLEGPGLTPPDGKFDFDNPPNRNDVGYTVVTICLVISALNVLLRLNARAFYLKKLSIPDCTRSQKRRVLESDEIANCEQTSCLRLSYVPFTLSTKQSELMLSSKAMFASFCGLCYRLTSSIGFYVHQWNVQVEHLIDFSYVRSNFRGMQLESCLSILTAHGTRLSL
jgi:hypothetical protein